MEYNEAPFIHVVLEFLIVVFKTDIDVEGDMASIFEVVVTNKFLFYVDCYCPQWPNSSE